MRAVGYIRVSSRRQEQEGASLESQEKAVRKYATDRGYTLVDIVSETYSGYYLRERKELAKVREMVRSKKVQVVLVNSLDRLSRDSMHQAVLMHEMIENAVGLESVTEKIDQTPIGQIMRQMLSMVAAIEREKTVERTQRGLNNRVESGVLIGGGPAKYGYNWSEDHTRYNTNPVQAEVVRKIFQLYLENYTVRGIASYLCDNGIASPAGKLWGVSTVSRILTDEFYKGVASNLRVKWILVDGKKKRIPHPNPTPLPPGIVPIIVDSSVWSQVANKREGAKQDSARHNPEAKSALVRSGFAVCGYCGKVMQVVRHHYVDKRNGKPHADQYACGSTGVRNTCSRPRVSVKVIDTAVWTFVENILNHVNSIAAVLLDDDTNAENASAHLQTVEQLIEQIEQEQDRLFKDLNGLTGRVRELVLKQLSYLEKQLTELKSEKLVVVPDANREENEKYAVENFLKKCTENEG